MKHETCNGETCTNVHHWKPVKKEQRSERWSDVTKVTITALSSFMLTWTVTLITFTRGTSFSLGEQATLSFIVSLPLTCLVFTAVEEYGSEEIPVREDITFEHKSRYEMQHEVNDNAKA